MVLRFKQWLIVCIMLLAAMFSALPLTVVYAATETYSNVLDDLKIDPNFHAEDYPEISGDFSLQVIQLAESTDGELLVYVYQPSGQAARFEASSINISTETGDNPRWKNYGLKFIGAEGVFFKYSVINLKVKDTPSRCYDVSSIYRPFNAAYDKLTENKVTDKAYAVGQLWTAKTENGKILYHMETRETIEIINPFSAYCRYDNGFKFYLDKCDAHFIAFTTNRQIDKLMEADVSYHATEVSESFAMGISYNTIINKEWDDIKTVKAGQKVATNPDGWFGKKYEWERIESAEEFIKKETLSDEAKKEISKCKYVLRFLETTYTQIGDLKMKNETYTRLTEVTILRLKFVTDGVTYNLGAVCNKINEMERPVNSPTIPSFWEWLSNLTGLPIWALKLILACIIIIIILPILIKLFRKRKKRREEAEESNAAEERRGDRKGHDKARKK